MDVSAPRLRDSGKTAQPPAELRLAVTFTGGVSLAVWMGGMAREMNLLVAATLMRQKRRAPSTTVPGTTVQGGEVRGMYLRLLDLLNVDCSIDVISGTSAGGINAVILGLANVQQLDLDGLRELWFKEGALGALLRDPADKQAPSLLYGDKALLEGLRVGLEKLAVPASVDQDTDVDEAADVDEDADEVDPTRIFITTTLLTGKATAFTDEYGTLVTDTDHHGLFSFSSTDLKADNAQALGPLALAARCSASFPVAFEPGFVSVGRAGDDAHPDMRAFTDAAPSQFTADGGLLANRPLGPALQAVFDRPAKREVRRVLAFVVPTVGNSAEPPVPSTLVDAPGLGAALAADLGAVLSQTISSDLTAIAEHNQRVRVRNDARQQLAVLGAQAGSLGEQFYPRYLTRRASNIAQVASAEVMKRMAAGSRAPDGRPAGYGANSRDAWNAAYEAAESALPQALPTAGEYPKMMAAGREALDEGRATVLAILSRVYRLTSAPQQKLELGILRNRVSKAMPRRADLSQADTLTKALGVAPQLPAAPAEIGTPRAQSAIAASALLNANMAAPGRQPWRELAEVIVELQTLMNALDAVERSPGSDGEFVGDLLDYLTAPSDRDDPVDTVAARLFDLHVARYVMQPDVVLADQAVELVQMSSDTRTCLDRRTLAQDKLTGLGMHHFGAFYKASWRANDWMWGRIDGAGWLVHLLLDPRRLRQLASEAHDPESFRDHLRSELEAVAGRAAPLGVWERLAAKEGLPDEPAEMEFLTTPTALPTSLPVTAMWVAAGLQQLIAGEELKHVAEQVENDRGDGANEGAAADFLAAYRSAVDGSTSAPNNGSYPVVPKDKAATVLNACQIPAETIAGEIGSPLFARTVTRALAVAVKMADPSKAAPPSLRPVLATAHTVTSLAYRITTIGAVARRPLIAALYLIALGAIACTSAINPINAVGLLAILAGLLLAVVCTARGILSTLAGIAVVAGAALAAAAYIPILRDHLFPWLENAAIPGLAKHPAYWAILVILLLLPPVSSVATTSKSLFQRIRKS